jgi:hypothetical protein
MVDLEEFLVTGVFGPVGRGATQADVVAAFGEPQYLTRARRSNPAMLLYGDVEFRLFADRLTAIVFSLEPGRPLESPIDSHGLWPQSRRAIEIIDALLTERGVTWSLDTLLSEPDAPIWITDRNVNIGFQDGHLHRAGAYA